MAQELVVVKLGGSAVTVKSRPFTYRRRVVESLARVMAESGQRLVLVHGGGSFGHPVAKSYGLSSSSSHSTAEGVSRTRAAMFRLNQLVCSSLSAGGLRPYTFTPFSLLNESKKGSEWLNSLLDSNLTPVTFGDVIPDEGGFRILSGDTICVELSRILEPARCIFVLDVGGILDQRGRVVARVDSGIIRSLRGRGATDATGGILLKAKEALKIASRKTQVMFVSGFSPRDFSKALKAQRFHGSTIQVS